MSDKLIFKSWNVELQANISDLTDSIGVERVGLREHFKKAGWNFFLWENEIVVKAPRQVFIELIERELRLSWPDGSREQAMVQVEHLSSRWVAFSLGPQRSTELESLIDNGDRLRVYVNTNLGTSDDYYDDDGDGEKTSQTEILLTVLTVIGDPGLGQRFLDGFTTSLKQVQEQDKVSLIKWIFSSEHGNHERCFRIKKDWQVDQCFYPWIGGDLNAYYRKFLESRSQILIAFGEPGTGKTTFLRDLICETGLNAYISYDLKILTSDQTFVRYLTNQNFDIVIIEDADELLTSGRGEYNKVVAKILNVSDGLIKLPRKKLIFTTNLANVKSIDPAIIRAGRCYDVLEFKKLTYHESVAVCRVIGVKLPEPQKSYTLAELFFMKSLQENTDPFVQKHGERLERTFGFIT